MKTILVLHIYACLGSKTKYINLFVSGKYHREIYISQKMFIKFTTTLAQSPTQEKFSIWTPDGPRVKVPSKLTNFLNHGGHKKWRRQKMEF